MKIPRPVSLTPKELIILDVQGCSLCARMLQSRRVLSEHNGDWNAEVLFVAEAPGRLGAEITGIPLSGDRTGDRFDELLAKMRWARSDIFLTNAVLCNPRDQKGNNDKPSNAEIRNCSEFLSRTIDLVDPKLVVALGRVALGVLRTIRPHNCNLKGCCGRIIPWGDRHLGVLYHPSPLSQTQRAWTLQMKDAESLALFAKEQLGIRPSRQQI